MNKRERLLRHLESTEPADYTPAAFFMHFGESFKSGKASIEKHKEFFRFTDMDFVKIQLELDFPKIEVKVPKDFERIPSLPIEFYRSQLEVVKALVEDMKEEAMVILTLYSPFMIAGEMAGNEVVIASFEQEPDPVFKALKTIAESLLGFVRECKKLGLDGFYHSTQGAEKKRFRNKEIFPKWIKPIDHLVMNEIAESFSFNILHICDYHQEYGGYDDLTQLLDYPGHVVNVSTEIGGKILTPAELLKFFGRPYMGGTSRLGPLSSGSEVEARRAAREALQGALTGFILGADCTVPRSTPWGNLQRAIEEAHYRGS